MVQGAGVPPLFPCHFGFHSSVWKREASKSTSGGHPGREKTHYYMYVDLAANFVLEISQHLSVLHHAKWGTRASNKVPLRRGAVAVTRSVRRHDGRHGGRSPRGGMYVSANDGGHSLTFQVEHNRL